MTRLLRRALGALSLAGLATSASANCGSIITDYLNALALPLPYSASDIILSSPECFGGGPTTALVQMSGTQFQQAQAISRILASRHLAEGPITGAAASMTGMAAGGKLGPFNAWINLADSDAEQRYATVNAYAWPGGHARNEMGILNTVLGLDYPVTPAVVAGVSLGFDRGDGHGGNSAPDFDLNQIDSRGFVLAPYLGWQINRELAFDASLGVGRGRLKTSLADTYRNDLDSSRWYAAANLNYERWLGNLQLTGRASLMHGVERFGNIDVRDLGGLSYEYTGSLAGTGARNTIDELRLGAQLGYWMDGVMPYIGIGYVNDFRRATSQRGATGDPIGNYALEWRLGANFYAKASGLTGGIAYAQETGRSHQKSHNLTANLNLRF